MTPTTADTHQRYLAAVKQLSADVTSDPTMPKRLVHDIDGAAFELERFIAKQQYTPSTATPAPIPEFDKITGYRSAVKAEQSDGTGLEPFESYSTVEPLSGRRFNRARRLRWRFDVHRRPRRTDSSTVTRSTIWR